MRSVHTSFLGVAVAAAVLAGCTGLAAEEGSKPKKVCFNRREINMIRALDDQHAFVKLGATRHYMLTLDKTCTGLKIARQIAVSEGINRVCGDGFTLLSFETPVVGQMRCRIEVVDSVADIEAAMALIESRKGPQ